MQSDPRQDAAHLSQGSKMDYARHDVSGTNGYSSQPTSSQKVGLFALIKHHLRDWLWIFVLIALELIMYLLIPPFHRFVNEPMIGDYMYPRKSSTIPTWLVGVIAVFVPFVTFLLYLLKHRNVRDFHSAFLGLATAIVITALFTDSIKNLVGMPRPDFFHRCFPDGIAVYSSDTERRVLCHPGDEKAFRDAYKSFPSGHVSWAFAGLGYLSLYLAGKFGLFDRRGYSSRVFWVLLPTLAAGLIGVTRVNNYQHRWVDIIAAGLLGLLIAYLSYRQFYPSIYAREWAGYPYEYAPQGIFSHGLHGPRALPMMNSYANSTVMPLGLGGNAYDPRRVPNDVETGL